MLALLRIASSAEPRQAALTDGCRQRSQGRAYKTPKTKTESDDVLKRSGKGVKRSLWRWRRRRRRRRSCASQIDHALQSNGKQCECSLSLRLASQSAEGARSPTKPSVVETRRGEHHEQAPPASQPRIPWPPMSAAGGHRRLASSVLRGASKQAGLNNCMHL